MLIKCNIRHRSPGEFRINPNKTKQASILKKAELSASIENDPETAAFMPIYGNVLQIRLVYVIRATKQKLERV